MIKKPSRHIKINVNKHSYIFILLTIVFYRLLSLLPDYMIKRIRYWLKIMLYIEREVMKN